MHILSFLGLEKKRESRESDKKRAMCECTGWQSCTQFLWGNANIKLQITNKENTPWAPERGGGWEAKTVDWQKTIGNTNVQLNIWSDHIVTHGGKKCERLKNSLVKDGVRTDRKLSVKHRGNIWWVGGEARPRSTLQCKESQRTKYSNISLTPTWHTIKKKLNCQKWMIINGKSMNKSLWKH